MKTTLLHNVVLTQGKNLLYTDLQFSPDFVMIIVLGGMNPKGGIVYVNKKTEFIRNNPGRETGSLCKSV